MQHCQIFKKNMYLFIFFKIINLNHFILNRIWLKSLVKWPNTEHNLLKGQQLVIASMWKAVQVNQRSRNCRIKRRQMEVDDALPGPISWRRSLGRPMATMRSPPPLAFQLLWTTRIGTRQRRALIGQSHKLPAFPWIDFSWGNGKRFFFLGNLKAGWGESCENSHRPLSTGSRHWCVSIAGGPS